MQFELLDNFAMRTAENQFEKKAYISFHLGWTTHSAKYKRLVTTGFQLKV